MFPHRTLTDQVMKQETAAGEFKAKRLKLLDEVQQQRKEIVIN